jgi:hypothetical protein
MFVLCGFNSGLLRVCFVDMINVRDVLKTLCHNIVKLYHFPGWGRRRSCKYRPSRSRIYLPSGAGTISKLCSSATLKFSTDCRILLNRKEVVWISQTSWERDKLVSSYPSHEHLNHPVRTADYQNQQVCYTVIMDNHGSWKVHYMNQEACYTVTIDNHGIHNATKGFVIM